MKKWISLLFPTLMWGQNYHEIIESLNSSLLVQSAQQLEKSALENAKIAEGKNYPSIDTSLTAIRFLGPIFPVVVHFELKESC